MFANLLYLSLVKVSPVPVLSLVLLSVVGICSERKFTKVFKGGQPPKMGLKTPPYPKTITADILFVEFCRVIFAGVVVSCFSPDPTAEQQQVLRRDFSTMAECLWIDKYNKHRKLRQLLLFALFRRYLRSLVIRVAYLMTGF